ncbi:hypothetical protein OnM2_098042 [Erysiphe neolycopersici]|uniref:Uncharacterized protein n=1 Tax=Erysiphe neolycopersici TaxID=212602 RepID=A0A420HAC2_9PEZI|nr:hypothetical protein OnM2_098042 [Erysiphe neolycopersici]
MTHDPQQWPDKVERATLELNKRVIAHLMHSPSQIFFGFNPVGIYEATYLSKKRKSLLSALKIDISNVILEEEEHMESIVTYVAKRARVREEALERQEES